jgi:hypothetical protein
VVPLSYLGSGVCVSVSVGLVPSRLGSCLPAVSLVLRFFSEWAGLDLGSASGYLVFHFLSCFSFLLAQSCFGLVASPS